MKQLKKIGLVSVAAIIITAFFVASSASATTLEVAGIKQNQSVSLTMSLKSGTSMTFELTPHVLQNTCTASEITGSTVSPFSGTTVTAPLGAWTFGSCTGSITVDNPGKLHIEWEPMTTSGTVFSSGAEITVWSVPLGAYLNVKTGSGTHVGTITGVNTGHAELQIKAVLNGGFLAPSLVWEGAYTITSPTGFGVVS